MMRPIMSKPCARTSCTKAIISNSKPSDFKRRRYCSISCSVRHRIEQGWDPTAGLTRETRIENGRRVGQLRAKQRRKEMLSRAWTQVRTLIGDDIEAKLSREELASVRYAVTQAFLKGKEQGYETGYWKRRKDDDEQQQGAA